MITFTEILSILGCLSYAGDKFEVLADDNSDEEDIADLESGIFAGEFV